MRTPHHDIETRLQQTRLYFLLVIHSYLMIAQVDLMIPQPILDGLLVISYIPVLGNYIETIYFLIILIYLLFFDYSPLLTSTLIKQINFMNTLIVISLSGGLIRYCPQDLPVSRHFSSTRVHRLAVLVIVIELFLDYINYFLYNLYYFCVSLCHKNKKNKINVNAD